MTPKRKFSPDLSYAVDIEYAPHYHEPYKDSGNHQWVHVFGGQKSTELSSTPPGPVQAFWQCSIGSQKNLFRLHGLKHTHCWQSCCNPQAVLRRRERLENARATSGAAAPAGGCSRWCLVGLQDTKPAWGRTNLLPASGQEYRNFLVLRNLRKKNISFSCDVQAQLWK